MSHTAIQQPSRPMFGLRHRAGRPPLVLRWLESHHALATRLPGAFIQNSVGATYELTALSDEDERR